MNINNRDYKIEDLEKLLDNINEEAFIKDEFGIYKYVNKKFAENIGLNKEDIIGRSDYDLQEHKILKNNNKSINLTTNDNKTVYSEVINELKNEIKDEAQKQIGAIINNIIDVYAIVKIENKKVKFLEISDKGNNLIGWTVEELNNLDYYKIIQGENKEDVKNVILRTGYEGANCNFSIKCKDGSWIIIDSRINKLHEGIYMIAAKDVTSIAELKKDKEDLKYAVEIEALKTEFFANLSHEFKTPLNIILSTVQLIMDYMRVNGRYPSVEKSKKYLNSIKQNSYRLLRLANNMIDITKIEGNYYQINISNHNIVEVVENIVQSLTNYIKDNKRNIIFDTIEEEIVLACDPEQIERIILNLLSNAMKFTTNEGNIYVNIDVNDSCNKVIITIGNDGEPIHSEDAERIFKRFTQSERLLTRSAEGSGIGLALTKSLVELHRGTIYVNTEIKNGTEFCIELPIRKIINSKDNNVREKNIESKVEKFQIEFSDIYN